jgi:prepilin-type processing-associated H-X9-DG protein
MTAEPSSDENRAALQVRSGGYGWSLAALIAGVLPFIGLFIVPVIGLLAFRRVEGYRHFSMVELPLVGLVLAGVAVVCGAGALVASRRRDLAGLGLALGLVWIGGHVWFTPKLETIHRHDCQKNLHQDTLEIGMYAVDHDNFLPPAGTWPEAIFPYTKNTDELCCPDDPDFSLKAPPGNASSFSMNRYLGGAPLSSAGSLPLLFDGDALRGDKTTAAFRHAGGLNVSYADGHAQWLSRQAFLDGSLKPKTQP